MSNTKLVNRIKDKKDEKPDEPHNSAHSKLLKNRTETEDRPTTMDEVEAATVVKTKKGLPDMRIKEHRQAFMFDPNLRSDGRPDERKLVNRTDLQALKEKRGDDKPNLIFTQDGELR